MKQLSIREIRRELPHLEALLTAGEELVITRRGKAIARIVPIVERKPIRSLAEHRAKIPFQKIPSEVLIRRDRDGR